MVTDAAIKGALNNAAWCDIVCRAHGLATNFSANAWECHSPAPPLYPNLVTLSPGGVDAQLGRVRELGSSVGKRGWAVKDSFNSLDLASEGFEVLFDAMWVHGDVEVDVVSSGLELAASRVASREGLVAWEAGWRGDEGAALGGSLGIFPPLLLKDARVAFVAVSDGHDLVGGVIANRAAGVVGVTNMFCRRGPERHVAAVCMAEVSALWPGLPVVGYASGEELATLRSLGLKDAGEVRVWSLMDTSGS